MMYNILHYFNFYVLLEICVSYSDYDDINLFIICVTEFYKINHDLNSKHS